MKKIRVHLGKNSYDILICSNELDKLGLRLKRLNIGKDAVIVTNPYIKKLFGRRIEKALVSGGLSVRFETVPDPTIVPAESALVLAACAMSVGKSKVISVPAFGAPNRWPFK